MFCPAATTIHIDDATTILCADDSCVKNFTADEAVCCKPLEEVAAPPAGKRVVHNLQSVHTFEMPMPADEDLPDFIQVFKASVAEAHSSDAHTVLSSDITVNSVTAGSIIVDHSLRVPEVHLATVQEASEVLRGAPSLLVLVVGNVSYPLAMMTVAVVVRTIVNDEREEGAADDSSDVGLIIGIVVLVIAVGLLSGVLFQQLRGKKMSSAPVMVDQTYELPTKLVASGDTTATTAAPIVPAVDTALGEVKPDPEGP